MEGTGFDGELEALLMRVGTGSREAFAALYDRTAARAHGLVRRVVRDPALAEEVTQEVFFEVWRKAPSFDPKRGSALGWIMTLSHRRAVDRVRREQSHRRRQQRVRPDPGDYDVVAETVEGDLERRHVHKALGVLTPLQRQALELAYFGGHTYREVAQLVGAPLGTVKTRLRDGLARLRAALEEGP